MLSYHKRAGLLMRTPEKSSGEQSVFSQIPHRVLKDGHVAYSAEDYLTALSEQEDHKPSPYFDSIQRILLSPRKLPKEPKTRHDRRQP